MFKQGLYKVYRFILYNMVLCVNSYNNTNLNCHCLVLTCNAIIGPD